MGDESDVETSDGGGDQRAHVGLRLGEAGTDDDARALSDGRTARRQRNVDAALDALLDLIAEGQLDPTVESVADRAGVSHRSLYRYFETRDGMLEAAFDRVMEGLAPLLVIDVDPDASFDERADRFVASRVAAFMEFRQVGRTAMMNRRQEFIRTKVDESRSMLREQLAAHFAPELRAMPPDEREGRLLLADVAFQFEGLDYLFGADGESSESLARLLREHLRLALTHA